VSGFEDERMNRILIAKKLGIYAGCDIAWSNDTTAFYITFRSAS